MLPRKLTGFLLAVGMLLIPQHAEAAATVGFCGDPNVGCICIDWSSGGSTWIEIKCPSGGDDGWTTDWDGTPEDHTPGWTGSGDPREGDGGTSLAGSLRQAYLRAKNLAKDRARGDDQCCIGGKPYHTPNECSQLFVGNNLGMGGAQIIDNYIEPRVGDGVEDSTGNVPCSQGSAIWTKCCQHNPTVYVCSSFENLPTGHAAAFVIHEALHVAGQAEDKTTSVGPADAPTSGQIQQRVQEACNL